GRDIRVVPSFGWPPPIGVASLDRRKPSMAAHRGDCFLSMARASLGCYRGMRTLVLENEFVRMVLLPDKGADVMEMEYKPKGIDVLWHSPTGYRALDSYRG